MTKQPTKVTLVPVEWDVPETAKDYEGGFRVMDENGQCLFRIYLAKGDTEWKSQCINGGYLTKDRNKHKLIEKTIRWLKEDDKKQGLK